MATAEMQKRIDSLAGYLGGARRRTSTAALLGSLAAIVFLSLGSYFALIRHYERVVRGYYAGILSGVSSVQRDAIRRESYRGDLKRIALSVKGQSGVLAVWCTDRSGKLIFHTEEAVLRDFQSARLPFDYRESVDRTWTFSEGRPEANVVRLPNRLRYRMSVPIYAFGSEDVDFVFGIDVERFVFLPDRKAAVILYASGCVLGAFVVLFLPLLLVIRGNFGGVASHTRFILGTIGAEEGRVPKTPEEMGGEGAGAREAAGREEPPAEAETPEEVFPPAIERTGPEESGTDLEREIDEAVGEDEPRAPAGARGEWAGPDAKRSARPASRPAAKTARKKKVPKSPGDEAGGAGAVQPSVVENGIDEKMRMLPLIMLMDTKQAMFKKQEIELPFIQACGAVFHSRGVAGSYLHYARGKKSHVFAVFEFPDVQIDDASAGLSGLARFLEGEAGKNMGTVELMKSFNSYCKDNRLKLDASVLSIDESEKRVEYSAAGAARALYLKHGETDFKSLKLDVPPLGLEAADAFGEKVSYAEISFASQDIFLLTPSNAAGIFLGEESFEDVIRRVALSNRSGSAREICADVQAIFEPFKRKERAIPETSFAVAKFTGG